VVGRHLTNLYCSIGPGKPGNEYVGVVYHGLNRGDPFNLRGLITNVI
jgi:hypothetical protein